MSTTSSQSIKSGGNVITLDSEAEMRLLRSSSFEVEALAGVVGAGSGVGVVEESLHYRKGYSGGKIKELDRTN